MLFHVCVCARSLPFLSAELGCVVSALVGGRVYDYRFVKTPATFAGAIESSF